MPCLIVNELVFIEPYDVLFLFIVTVYLFLKYLYSITVVPLPSTTALCTLGLTNPVYDLTLGLTVVAVFALNVSISGLA